MVFQRASRLSLTLGLALLVGACTHGAQETFTFESQLAPTGSVHVESLNGAILLRRDASPGATRVHGRVTVRATGFGSKEEARAAARAVTLLESGDEQRLDLTVALPGGVRLDRFAVDVDLFVPAGVSVSALNDAGPVLVDGLPVGAITTAFGQIDLLRTAGNPVLRTLDAAVVVDDHQGDLDIRTSNAPIELVRVSGDVRATTSNGFLFCEALPPPGAELLLATTNAGVEVRLPFTFDALLAAITTPEALIFMDTGLAFREHFSTPGQLEGDLGRGGPGLVDVRTTFGDIVFRARR